jgi:uncharacterized peroxidase-related enzyme
MSFLKTVAEEEADDQVAAMYAVDMEHNGYLPNYSRIFSLHPGAYQAWGDLILSIRGAMDRRRYELATIGAANQLRSTYCSLAHASILEERFFETEDLRRIVLGQMASVLSDVDCEIVEFARKVADDATTVTEKDITGLREAGLTDRDIFDVVLAVAARSFFTKVLDATGTLADASYNEMDAELRQVLTVGRPIEST